MEEDFDDKLECFGKVSKINSAALVNSTLNNLWIDFFRHYRAGQYLSANSDLDCIWTILGGEKGMDKDSTKETEYQKLEESLSRSGSLQDSLEVKGFGKITPEQLKKFVSHKSIILKKSVFLRRLQNSQGKGTAYYNEDEGDFD